MIPAPRAIAVRSAILLLLLGAATGVAPAQIELPDHGNASIYDLAGVISPQHEQAMEQQHLALLEASGVAIVVVTVPTLEGEAIGEFAVRVGQRWGVGRKGEDRGIVVAFAVQERRIFIGTGYGVEGFLPDGRVGRILDEYVIPHLRRDDFSTGLQQASAALVQASAKEYGLSLQDERRAVPESKKQEPGIVSKIFSALFVLFVIYLIIRNPRMALFMLFYGSRGRGHGGGGGFGGGGFGGSGGFGGGGFGGGGAGRGF